MSVAESGSFTKAAMNHYVSQTAVTRQIHALEETVGARLLDRSSRPASLTPAGRVFLKETREILGKMDSAQHLRAVWTPARIKRRKIPETAVFGPAAAG